MPEYKSAYFTKDGKWFDDREDADLHEKKEEMIEYLMECHECVGRKMAELVVQSITFKYKADERYQYRRDILSNLPGDNNATI